MRAAASNALAHTRECTVNLIFSSDRGVDLPRLPTPSVRSPSNLHTVGETVKNPRPAGRAWLKIGCRWVALSESLPDQSGRWTADGDLRAVAPKESAGSVVR